jgi:hypothetical protein
MSNYDPKVTPWLIDADQFPKDWPLEAQLRFLLGYAILAPSSHNTQPWRFAISANRIDLHADLDGWLKVADPDRREVFLSLGCALENLLVAAERFGLAHETSYVPERGDELLAAGVTFREGGKRSAYRDPRLLPAITRRHTNHQRYDDSHLEDELIDQLEACCVEEEIELLLTADLETKHRVDDLVVRGDAVQFARPDFREELGFWIGKGVFGASWLMSKLGQLAVTHLNLGASQAKKDSAVLMSSPLVGVISCGTVSRERLMQAGQVYQRLSLLAAIHGVWCQPMSQVIEVPELRRELADLTLNPQATPVMVFRMGRAAPEKEHTPRRPLDEVLA